MPVFCRRSSVVHKPPGIDGKNKLLRNLIPPHFSTGRDHFFFFRRNFYHDVEYLNINPIWGLDLTYEELKPQDGISFGRLDHRLDLTYEELMLVVTFHMMSDGRT